MSMFTPPGIGARSRRRHQTAGRLLVVVLALAAIVGTAWWAWTSSTGPAARTTPTATPTRSCPTPLPSPLAAKDVKVNVYNATDRRGLAARVAGELGRRGFRVGAIDDDPLQRAVTGAAEVRHGPAGAGAARTVVAHVAGAVSPPPVVLVPDQRRGKAVDLVLGATFVRLAPPQQAAAALSPSPEPAPRGC